MSTSTSHFQRFQRNSAWLLLGLLPAMAWPLAAQGPAQGIEHRAYEGVVSWKQKTIGTDILVEIGDDHSVSGWIRLGRLVPIDQGSVTEDGVSFTAAGNSYQINERKGRIVYSGTDGQGDRLVTPLTGLTGRLQELLEETHESGAPEAVMEVDGRQRVLKYDEPALWKRSGAPFEKFSRMEELLGKTITVWAADADLRGGVIVAIEEPAGMDIPLKVPKTSDKAKDQKQK